MHHRSGATLFLLLAAAAAPSNSDAQLFSHETTHSQKCPMSLFKADAEAVEKACCSGGPSTCKPGKAPAGCSLDCAVVFVPFFDRCKSLISNLFDGDDGREDGHSIGFEKLYSKCTDGKGVTLAQTSTRVKALEEKGCTLNYGDSGVWDQGGGGKHRRLQFYRPSQNTKCADVKTMNKRAQRIDKVCCPHGKSSCPNGLPSTCGPACAMVFGPFLTDCRVMLTVSMGSMVPRMDAVAEKCNLIDTHPIILAIATAVCNRCGDGKIGGDEQCDSGEKKNSKQPNSVCRPDCKKARCGDGILDDSSRLPLAQGRAQEQCDPPGPLCTQGCKLKYHAPDWCKASGSTAAAAAPPPLATVGVFTASLAPQQANTAGPAGTYTFKIAQPTSAAAKSAQSYNALMVDECRKYGMKPICNYYTWCQNDPNALYIGQYNGYYLSYPQHRRNNNWMPSGFSAIRSKWQGKCVYSGNGQGGKALCNTPSNTHNWKTPTQYNPGFICGYRGALHLGYKNGVPARYYQFKVVTYTTRSGRYSSVMITECRKYGMKPVCDYPSWCKNDRNALYIGQSSYLSSPSYRNNNNYVPSGFAAIRDVWRYKCSYTGNARGNYAYCNTPSNTHSWRYPSQTNPGFVCGAVVPPHETPSTCFNGKDDDRDGLADCDDPDCSAAPSAKSRCASSETGLECVDGLDNDGDGKADCRDNECSSSDRCRYPPFSAKLTGRNGEGTRSYLFQTVSKLPSAALRKGGSYSALMVDECRKYGMKPICDYYSYCHNDPNALYIGQRKGQWLSSTSKRRNNNWMPSGFSAIRSKWQGKCVYTANGHSNYAYCNTPYKQEGCWKLPTQYNSGFICGKMVEICNDRTDNDNDGQADCADPDCASSSACRGSETACECFNGKDDDGDGKADCNDPDCVGPKLDRRSGAECRKQRGLSPLPPLAPYLLGRSGTTTCPKGTSLVTSERECSKLVAVAGKISNEGYNSYDGPYTYGRPGGYMAARGCLVNICQNRVCKGGVWFSNRAISHTPGYHAPVCKV